MAKGGLNKLRAHHKELKQADLEDSLKSVPPGEWCELTHPTSPEKYLCFINSMIDEKFSSVQVVETLSAKSLAVNPEEFLKQILGKAFKKRKLFKNYTHGSRLFYGMADGLPGLIIDHFHTNAIIQINTAGVDRYRDLIKNEVETFLSGKAYFLDNPKYREKEFLPVFQNEQIPSLVIEENGLRYNLRSEVLQKVGFYYDHRENRSQLISHMQRIQHTYKKGLDLFCYAGAWGMCALKAGLEKATFVDQGDFEIDVKGGLELNGFSDQGTFVRQDVFRFLDEAIAKGQTFDLILCDPPAFAKSYQQKDQALEGYSKLHRKVFKIAESGSLLAFSSCTHYVNHDEFQKNILEAAQKEQKKIQLIYTGIQGWDHPIKSQMDKSNYIKSYFYIME